MIFLFIAGAALLTACNNGTKSDTATTDEDTTWLPHRWHCPTRLLILHHLKWATRNTAP